MEMERRQLQLYSPRAVPAARVVGVQVLPLPGDRATVAGPLDRIGAVLAQLRRQGRLMAATDPIPDGRPGWYAVTVRLMPERTWAPPAPRPPFWTRRRIVSAAGGGLVLGAGLAWLVAVTVTWIAANLATIAVGLVVAGVLAAAFGRTVVHVIIVRCRG